MSTLSVFDVSIDVLLLFISQLHSWRLINDLNKTFSINQNEEKYYRPIIMTFDLACFSSIKDFFTER